MIFVMCVNSYAVHFSSWEYSDVFEEYATRITVHTEDGLMAIATINTAGYCYDLAAFIDYSTYYAEDDPDIDTYGYGDASKGISDIYGLYPSDNVRQSTTSITTDNVNVNYELEIMHTYGMSYALFSDYIMDPDKGDYTYDDVFAVSEEMAVADHKSHLCPVCEYWH